MSQKGAGPRSPGLEKICIGTSLPKSDEAAMCGRGFRHDVAPATVDCRTLIEVCVKLFAAAFFNDGWASRGELCFPGIT